MLSLYFTSGVLPISSKTLSYIISNPSFLVVIVRLKAQPTLLIENGKWKIENCISHFL